MVNHENGDLNRYQDVPDGRGSIEMTSSIGGLWPAELASFDRLKGIYTPGVIDSEEELVSFLRIFEEQSTCPNFGNDYSRISFRAVIDRDLLLSCSDRLRPCLEAVILLEGSQSVFSNAALVYIARNHTNRQSNPVEIKQYIETITNICETQERRSVKEIMRRVKSRGYDAGVLSFPQELEEREAVIDQIYRLYQRFDWSREEVEAILTNPNNIIGVALFNDEIVSAGITEMAQIPIGENVLRIVELTEAATRNDHARNGLYTAVSTALLLELEMLSQNNQVLGGEVDIVFGECNGNAPGVLKTAKIQGRRFSWELGRDFGFPSRGILSQHVPISGSARLTAYNDLFPAYLTRELLYNLYGGSYEY